MRYIFLFLLLVTRLTFSQELLVEFNTSMGSFIVELNQKKAPITVRNFLRYVDEGFYDGLIFHRVINGLIQGGGFDDTMKKRATRAAILNESTNRLSNVVGTIAMARTNDPNSATAQFYINVANNTFLNYQSPKQPGYCVFGRVIQGLSVVNAIKEVPTHQIGRYRDVPEVSVIINRVRRVEQKLNGESKPASNLILPVAN